jgi:hypothetical protein
MRIATVVSVRFYEVRRFVSVWRLKLSRAPSDVGRKPFIADSLPLVGATRARCMSGALSEVESNW